MPVFATCASRDGIYDEVDAQGVYESPKIYAEIDMEDSGYAKPDYVKSEDYLTVKSAYEMPKRGQHKGATTSDSGHVYLSVVVDNNNTEDDYIHPNRYQ